MFRGLIEQFQQADTNMKTAFQKYITYCNVASDFISSYWLNYWILTNMKINQAIFVKESEDLYKEH